MKALPFSALCEMDFDFKITDVFPEQWKDRREFSLYKSKPRPVSALFFICSDLTVCFVPMDGSPAVTARRGDVVFIPRGIRYCANVLGGAFDTIGTYTVNLHFFDENHEEFLLSDRIEILCHRGDNRRELHIKRLRDGFHRLTETSAEGKRNPIKVKGEFFSLLDFLISTDSRSNEFYYPIRKGAEALCEEWNKNEKIEKYAQMSEVSVTYFYRCFRKWSGKSPVEYRNTLRLSNAESLLRCTDMRIQEISKAIGFDDPFYFCRIFSDTYGLSPKHYRARVQQE